MKMKLFNLTLLLASLLVGTQAFAQSGTIEHNTNTAAPATNTNAAAPTNNATIIDTSTMSTVNAKPSTPTPTPEQDALITKTLKSMISNSATLSKLPVEITTSQGVVSLQGTVNSDSEASLLVETAESIVGVSDVNTTNLAIKDSKQPLSDMMITAKIKGLLIKEKLFGEKDVAAINTSVETKNGVVYLTGVVDNKAQIDNAIAIIKQNVPGIVKVEYNVKHVEIYKQ